MRPEIVAWWRQAMADLETADVLLRAGRYYAVSWFAQQAVEKGLKALYIERRGVLAPRTHDLRFLATEVMVPAWLLADITLINPAFEPPDIPITRKGLRQ